MNNTIFYLSQAGLLTKISGLSTEVATNAFNENFEGKEMLYFLIKHCKGNPRRLNPQIIYDLIKIADATGVYINDSIDVDNFVLDNFDAIWDAAMNNKSMSARLYVENTRRGYIGLLKSRNGEPIMFLTQEEHPPLLNDVSECQHFGVTFSGYYKDSLKDRKALFREIKKIGNSYARDIETLNQEQLK